MKKESSQCNREKGTEDSGSGRCHYYRIVYHCHTVLSGGDALFVYTDGIPEANASDESMYGEDRLETVLSETSKEDTPQMIMQKVRDSVLTFAGDAPQCDDLTMLCLVIKERV